MIDGVAWSSAGASDGREGGVDILRWVSRSLAALDLTASSYQLGGRGEAVVVETSPVGVMRLWWLPASTPTHVLWRRSVERIGAFAVALPDDSLWFSLSSSGVLCEILGLDIEGWIGRQKKLCMCAFALSRRGSSCAVPGRGTNRNDHVVLGRRQRVESS